MLRKVPSRKNATDRPKERSGDTQASAWELPTDFYRALVELKLNPRRPANLQAPGDASAESGDTPAWIYDTILVVDLDQTLIQSAPVLEQRPTPFPILADGEIEVECQMGRRYFVRGGLRDFGKILDLPWRAKVLLSRSRQNKVNEAAQKIHIDSTPLIDRMDACVGAELLQEFATRQGIRLSYNTTRSLSNPSGKPAKAKPGEIVFLKDLRALGAAIREGDDSRAAKIVWQSAVQPGYSLVIDDQPYYEPVLECQAFYRILPFTRIEQFKILCIRWIAAAPFQFNFLDFIWRASAAPFGYLHFLLRKNLSWTDFTHRLNLESNLANALRRRLTWRALCRRHQLQDYLDFALERRPLEEKLIEARHLEHAKVYRTLCDYIFRDTKKGWRVLLLGRDMDYVFDAVRSLFPNLVRSNKVVTLPLSRSAISGMSEDLLSRLILSTLRLQGAVGKGLLIYDVGFHGTIPSFIRGALQRQAWAKIKRVEVRLLNACDCKSPEDDGKGRTVTFHDWEGAYVLSREFGISIERSPHTKGRLERVSPRGRRFRFQHSPHNVNETRLARSLQKRMAGLVRTSVQDSDESPEFLRRIAKGALSRVVEQTKHYLRDLRRNWQGFYDCGRSEPTRAVHTVIYPYCGVDLFTPLLCFTSLSRLILSDRMPIRWSKTLQPVDVPSAVGYLAELATAFVEDASHMRQRMLSVRQRFNHSEGSAAQLPEVHAAALLATPLLLSMAGVLPKSTVTQIQPSRRRHEASLRWCLRVGSRRPVLLEYHADDHGLRGRRASRRWNRLLKNTHSSLILRGLDQWGSQVNAARLAVWTQRAELVVHDDSLRVDPGDEERSSRPFIPVGDCLQVIKGAAHHQDSESGQCYLRLNRRPSVSRPVDGVVPQVIPSGPILLPQLNLNGQPTLEGARSNEDPVAPHTS